MISPEQLLKTLADTTRLRMVLLLTSNTVDELCVCDLMAVLKMDQPKISRHLAVLRKSDILVSRKNGQWVHYKINDQLPQWALAIISKLLEGSESVQQFKQDLITLNNTSLTC